ncbi:MAG: hypothetical protein LBI77_01380 [Puniceicoccales bacterium]|nr:hypothetical protein [Puniceicoccales bacterium]
MEKKKNLGIGKKENGKSLQASGAETSLFLRAKGPYDSSKNRDYGGKYAFDIGDGKFERGEFICIANPTYDKTFKLLFTPVNITDTDPVFVQLCNVKSSKLRLMSLLNSIIYPHFEKDERAEHIVEIELETTELLAGQDEDDDNNDETFEKALKALRCDIVCKCTVQKSHQAKTSKSETLFVYFDIEMQRADIPGRINAFLRYRDILKNKFKVKEDDEVKLIAFLNYKTQGVAMANVVVTTVAIDSGTNTLRLVDEREAVEAAKLSKLIGLPAIVEEIKSNNEVKISDAPLGTYGREWLKLLGTQWWAERENKESDRYVVPQNADCPGVREALTVLSRKGITDEALREEIDRLFSAKNTAKQLQQRGKEEGREEGEKIGALKEKLKTLMKNFIKKQEFDDDDIEEIEGHSLAKDFVKEVWDSLAENLKNQGNLGDFIAILGEKGLLKE